MSGEFVAAMEDVLELYAEADDPRRPVLQDAATAHLDAGLAALAEDGYLSTHWLGTFALLALEPVEQ